MCKDQVQRKEATNRDENDEVEIASQRIIAGVCKVVHHIGPAFKSARLEYNKKGLGETIKVWDAVIELLLFIATIDFVWIQLEFLPDRPAD